LAITFPDNQLLFYFHARLLISFFGSIIPIVAYKIGKEFKFDFSIHAALIFAFFPSFVIHSHYITPDVLITLLTLIIILFTLKFVSSENRKKIYLATFFSAVNTAEKYPGLISFVIVFLGVFLNFSKKGMDFFQNNYKKVILFCFKLVGLFLLSLYFVAPNLFIQFGNVIDAITFEARSTHLGADNLGWLGNMIFYVKSYFSWVNLIGIFLILSGVLFLIKNKDGKNLFLFYGFIYWIIMSLLALHWERWALPMYITPNFFAAIGISYILDFSKRNWIRKYLSFLFIFIFIAYQLIFSLSLSIKISFLDTRVVAQEYCRDKGITKDNTVFEGYTPLNLQFPQMIFDYEYESFDEIRYVILSSQMYQRYYNEPDRYKNEINFYNKIRNENTLIYEISPTQVDSKNMKQAIENIGYYIKLKLGNKSYIRLNGPTVQLYEIAK